MSFLFFSSSSSFSLNARANTRVVFEFVRCRQLYEKHIEWNPSNSQTWIKFAELERGLDDIDRCRAIFELAVSQDTLDMPELVWKAFIDFEEEEGEYERTRALYERLLEKTDHVKVWISYAQFELDIPDDEDEDEEEEQEDDNNEEVSDEAKTRARAVFRRAHKTLRDADHKEDCVALLNAWLAFERTHGDADDQEAVARQMPRRVKKRRAADDGSMEEYVDYVFPADEQQVKNLSSIMAMAQKWKQEKEGGEN